MSDLYRTGDVTMVPAGGGAHVAYSRNSGALRLLGPGAFALLTGAFAFRTLDDHVAALTPAGADAAVAGIEVALADGKVLTGTSASYPGDGRDRRLRWTLTDARERFDVIVGGGGERQTGLDAVTRLVDRLRTTVDVRDDARVLINALSTPTGDCDG